MNEDINNIISWAHDRNLINGSTVKDQFVKLAEEFGELAAGIARGKNFLIEDAIGDMVVVLTILSEIQGRNIYGVNYQNSPYIENHIINAYNVIKGRKGKMVDGVFVKEE